MRYLSSAVTAATVTILCTHSIARVSRSKSEARTSYNKLSRWYDVLAEQSEKRFRDVGLRKLKPIEGEHLLEIGFGTGHGLLALAQAVGNSGKAYGLDLSEGMLKITRARVEKAGLSQRVTLIWGDGANLPFQANYFDAIFMSFTLELFDTPEIPLVLHACQRVLRPDGRICVVAMSKRRNANLATRLYEWSHRQFPKYVDCRPIFVRQSLAESGFQIVEAIEMSMWRLPVAVVLAKKAI
jgi:ubiquinone/menaquinone biosynthesis C-methylase UbiE